MTLKRLHHEIIQAIESGESLSKLEHNHEYSTLCKRYRSFYKEIEQDVRLEQSRAVGFKKKTIHVFVGPSGSHMVKHILAKFPSAYYMRDNSMQSAGSYDGQSAVMFKNAHANNIMSVHAFLRYTDGYPVEAPVKDGYVAWIPEHILFTTNTHPSKWWPNLDPMIQAQVERRIDIIRVYKNAQEFDDLEQNKSASS